MANGDDFLIQQIPQAAENIMRGVQLGQQRRQQQQLLQQKQQQAIMKQAKQKIDALRQDRDAYIPVLGDVPESAVPSVWNMVVQTNNAIPNAPKFKGMDPNRLPGKAEKYMAKELAIFQKQRDNGIITDTQLATLQQEAHNRAVRKSESPEERQDLRQMLEFGQQQAFGSGAPITTGQGFEQQTGRVGPTGVVHPLRQQGSPQSLATPVTKINPELRSYITQRSDKFNTAEVTKEDLKVMSKLNTMRTLAQKNPKGAVGTVKKMVTRLTDVGRLSDFDVQFTDIDQSLAQQFKAFIAKKGRGKLSEEAVQNLTALVDIMEQAMLRNLNESLDSAVSAAEPFLRQSGLSREELRNMIAGPSYGVIKRFKGLQQDKTGLEGINLDDITDFKVE